MTAAARLLPGDQDGDGLCDGLELFLDYDPRNPKDHWFFHLECEYDQIDADGIGQDTVGLSARNTLFLSPGERVAVRMGMDRILNHQRFPAGFRFQLTPSTHARVAPHGGPATSKVLRLPGPKDHILAFDVEIPTGTAPDTGARPILVGKVTVPPLDEQVQITNPATGELITTLTVWCVWRLPPVTPTADLISLQKKLGSGGAPAHYIQLNWPRVAGPADALVIELARDTPDARWIPMHISPPDAISAGVNQRLGLGDYEGPLKYRVVPIRYFPP